MGAQFSDISLYTPIPFKVGTPEYQQVTSLENYVSDLYVRNMHGFKPNGATRITIQPSFYGIWEKTGKFGSVISTAPYYSYDEYSSLDKKGKYKYILDLIQKSVLQASDIFNWDRTVFEKAYDEVIRTDFQFRISYPSKLSTNKLWEATISIEKTEILTSVFVVISGDDQNIRRKLFDKKNTWCYDCAYILAKHSKWIDSDRFGISYGKNQIQIWYSIEEDKVVLFDEGVQVDEIDFGRHFLFQ